MSTTSSTAKMTYRFLGNSGLLVSKLSLGSWMGREDKYTVDAWYDMMAEEVMGGAIQKGVAADVWGREDLVITTKLFNGCKGFMECGSYDQGLGRKHIVEGTKVSLAARDIIEACETADRLGLIRPVVEQPQYNLFARNKVEYEYVDLYSKYKLGLTTWSPLAYGTLTGKYSAGTPEDSRFTKGMFKAGPLTEGFEERVLRSPCRGSGPNCNSFVSYHEPKSKSSFCVLEEWFVASSEQRVAMADQLKPIAKELGCSLAQMSIAWAASNENVSTVMVGTSLPSQLEDTLKALYFVSEITPDVKAKIDAVVNLVPTLHAMDQFAFLRMRYL
ncbi:Voltage-gated potassium channel subunit beta-2 [Phytophthora pseudosyringae]|uniref:Voltage-gated potassium channel subunit beta-2 n=1 Tax=Phytophthora pseudosyringae TaxID=221518 RepID=A0A8T1V8K4_9STRA|nr:Voltage-gated potassium channel subunit beta-2 [Phytophthora pseudosyringae]